MYRGIAAKGSPHMCGSCLAKQGMGSTTGAKRVILKSACGTVSYKSMRNLGPEYGQSSRPPTLQSLLAAFQHSFNFIFHVLIHLLLHCWG